MEAREKGGNPRDLPPGSKNVPLYLLIAVIVAVGALWLFFEIRDKRLPQGEEAHPPEPTVTVVPP